MLYLSLKNFHFKADFVFALTSTFLFNKDIQNYVSFFIKANIILFKNFSGRARWLMPIIPALWETMVGGSPQVSSSNQPGQHGKTPSLLRIQKLAGLGGRHL